MQHLGFEEVEACVLRMYNMATQYIAMRPILDLCEGNIADSGDVGREKVVREEDTVPGGSVVSDGGIRRGSGGGRQVGRSRGISEKVNHGIYQHVIIIQ